MQIKIEFEVGIVLMFCRNWKKYGDRSGLTGMDITLLCANKFVRKTITFLVITTANDFFK